MIVPSSSSSLPVLDSIFSGSSESGSTDSVSSACGRATVGVLTIGGDPADFNAPGCVIDVPPSSPPEPLLVDLEIAVGSK